MNGSWAQVCDGLEVTSPERAESRAVFWIADAIDRTDDLDRRTASVETAGAYVRAWRASRPGDALEPPDSDLLGFDDDRLLWVALGEVYRAAIHSITPMIAMHLDVAEAALRTWWERQREESS